MRYLFFFWALPLGLFWGWYFLSLNDMNFGLLFLSRDVHDLTFDIYGQVLGLDPAAIPGMAARACVLDTFLLLAIVAFRRRRAIVEWLRAARLRHFGEGSSPSA